MNNQNANRWLREKGVILEENFGQALIAYAEAYKKNRKDKRTGSLRPFGRQCKNCL